MNSRALSAGHVVLPGNSTGGEASTALTAAWPAPRPAPDFHDSGRLCAPDLVGVDASSLLNDEVAHTLQMLRVVAQLKDGTTGDHIQRMASLSARLGHAMGLSNRQCQALLLAAPLHDIGKVGVPDAILNSPAALDREQQDHMRRHPRLGYELLCLSSNPIFELAAEISLYHHERWDGSGYPEGLSGRDIPLSARIVAVADVYDALTSERSYKAAWPVEQALAHIDTLSGRQFDPVVVALLNQALTM